MSASVKEFAGESGGVDWEKCEAGAFFTKNGSLANYEANTNKHHGLSPPQLNARTD
jgi:hypothetical protein